MICTTKATGGDFYGKGYRSFRLLTHHQEQQGTEAKAIVPEKVEREVETAVDTLTPEELAKVEQIKDSIDMTDSEALLTYGAPAQKKIAAFSDSVLAQVRTKDSGEVGQLLGSLVTEVKEYDEKSQGGFLRKVPLLAVSSTRRTMSSRATRSSRCRSSASPVRSSSRASR